MSILFFVSSRFYLMYVKFVFYSYGLKVKRLYFAFVVK